MRFIAFFIFVAVPLTELALLIKIGEVIGILPTVLLVIVTAMIGVTLLRIQGLTVLKNARASLDAGRPPIDSVVDGVLLLVAGAFLLTPGLLTDTVGFLLLVPQVRQEIGRVAFSKLAGMGSFTVDGFPPPPGQGPPDGPGSSQSGPGARRSPAGPTIEGDFSRVDGDAEAEAKSGPTGDKQPGAGDKGSPWRK